ncbi:MULTISPECIES: SDR family NAD(P)-dependent oxidoreductase [Tenacibaculum]|uniref:SDR family NAD(P)-dependent oxidoreductase n=1 Tax=Tenacibaculum TaxID=104267 RepID=UPI001F2E8A29|nr:MULTISPECIES: SDR family oxidoreductase [Tenacibaculum]MCF2873717.1 SDR family oxidoreductase [Tenacibaculum sp. Cn5-1]MCF2933873.1 SDR family oxidoreductase [Tenacibaculum sp. Cn5-34]MCG7509545.1 SDR family oxidoreductase [Tenacibaculum sp. Cn5-46]
MKKVALITGASSGIGKELAIIHAQKKGDLILVARRLDKLEELKIELEVKFGITVITIAKDLSIPNAAKELYNEIQEMNVQVEFLINNAGFGLRGKFHELPWERQQQMINLNMVALTELMYLFLPAMVARNRGKILNTSSTASFMPGPLQAIYFATKSYVTFLSNAIAEELHDTNVTVTNLMPGATETEFAKTSGMDETGLFEKTVTAKSVAEDGYKAMEQGKLDVVSGLTFSQKLMMKSIPFTPKKTILKQIRKMQEV